MEKDYYHIIFSLFGWIIAILIAVYQLDRTRENNIASKKDEVKKTFQIDAYREISKSITNLSNSLHSATFFHQLFSLENHIKYKCSFDKRKFLDEIHDSRIIVLKSVAEFIRTVEANEIAILDFYHLRQFFRLRFQEFGEILGNFYLYLEQRKSAELETENILKEINEKISILDTRKYDLLGYLYDYRIELMNMVLSDIFNSQVPRRKPIDTNHQTLVELATKEYVEKELEEEQKRIIGIPNTRRIEN